MPEKFIRYIESQRAHIIRGNWLGTLEFLVLINQAPFPISGQFWMATVAPAYKSFSVLLSVCIDPFICTFSDRHTYI